MRWPPTRSAKALDEELPMKRNEAIERLSTRLQWESGGGLAHLAGAGIDALAAGAKALVGWVWENAEERPLISLLGAFQLGFAAGQWGVRRAKR